MQSSTDPRPVVVAVDASDSARDAAAWAADLAADWSAPLHLVHVVPGDPQDRPLDPLPGWLTTLLDVAERAGARPCTAEAQPGDLATALGCRLLAVHCWSDVYATPEGGAHRSRSPERLAAAGAAALDEQLQPIVDRHPSLDVQRKLVDAPPLQSLVEHAAGAKMIVVDPRCRTGQTGILMGSTSLALVEFATCPVVVVHPRRAVAAGTAAAAGTGVRS